MKRIYVTLVIVVLALLVLSAAQLFGQNFDQDFRPIVIEVVGRDPLTGETLYTRKAYVFFGPIDTGYYPYPLVSETLVTVQRFEHPDGERCNPAAPVIVETGTFYRNACKAEGK